MRAWQLIVWISFLIVQTRLRIIMVQVKSGNNRGTPKDARVLLDPHYFLILQNHFSRLGGSKSNGGQVVPLHLSEFPDCSPISLIPYEDGDSRFRLRGGQCFLLGAVSRRDTPRRSS